jgi:hypothetical protein
LRYLSAARKALSIKNHNPLRRNFWKRTLRG